MGTSVQAARTQFLDSTKARVSADSWLSLRWCAEDGRTGRKEGDRKEGRSGLVEEGRWEYPPGQVELLLALSLRLPGEHSGRRRDHFRIIDVDEQRLRRAFYLSMTLINIQGRSPFKKVTSEMYHLFFLTLRKWAAKCNCNYFLTLRK